MKLPNAENAVVDIHKLSGYCLNPAHSIGKHKARVFESALGLTADDAPLLRDTLLRIVVEAEAVPGEEDEFGQRFTVDFIMRTDAGEATVRSGWIIRTGEDFPRLTTCFVV
jgi:hypothetical protein